MRSAFDFYETPSWVVKAALKHMPYKVAPRILEPAYGHGAIAKIIQPHYPQSTYVGVEIRPDVPNVIDELYQADFLGWEYGGKGSPFFDLVIMNPPFRNALQFVQYAHTFLSQSGELWVFCWLPFLCGSRRESWMRRYTPDVFVFPTRPKFGLAQSTPKLEFAWMRWRQCPTESGVIKLI